MNSYTLITMFVRALNWNAFSYGAYKISALLVSYLLYTTLTKAEFTLWASSMSFIFFGLLILDGGFRKSIPRFCPEFSTTQIIHARFVRWLCATQATLLIVALFGYCWLLPHFFHVMHIPVSDSIAIRLMTLFFLQGCMGMMRIIYHTHFWNKQFNSLAMIILFIECILSLVCCFKQPDRLLLHKILTINCVGALCVTVISFFLLSRKTITIFEKKELSFDRRTHLPVKQFVIHTVCMWASTLIKALSERNFLFPYIVYSLGPSTGITFKLTHDAALFFYRIAVKVIGINDTALLAYARHNSPVMNELFCALVRAVVSLVVPLVIMALMSALIVYAYMPSYAGYITPFCIFTCGYMIEVILSPYERLLEVSLCYKLLMIAYLPYILLLGLMFYYQTISFLGLTLFVAIIQALRVVSALIMTYNAFYLVK